MHKIETHGFEYNFVWKNRQHSWKESIIKEKTITFFKRIIYLEGSYFLPGNIHIIKQKLNVKLHVQRQVIIFISQKTFSIFLKKIFLAY